MYEPIVIAKSQRFHFKTDLNNSSKGSALVLSPLKTKGKQDSYLDICSR